MPIQWLFTAFIIFAVVRALIVFKRGQLDQRKLFWWIFLWFAIGAVIWQPEITSLLASYLGIGRGVDAALYFSVVALFYALFQLSRKTDRLERSLTELVRRLALKDKIDDNEK